MHFMNPVPVMKLVEIIPGLATDDHTLTETRALASAMGKTCTTSQDVPGFVVSVTIDVIQKVYLCVF